jgi:hypothetical protein
MMTAMLIRIKSSPLPVNIPPHQCDSRAPWQPISGFGGM